MIGVAKSPRELPTLSPALRTGKSASLTRRINADATSTSGRRLATARSDFSLRRTDTAPGSRTYAFTNALAAK